MHFHSPQRLRIPVLISTVFHGISRNALSLNICKAITEGDTDSTHISLPFSLNTAPYKKNALGMIFREKW